MSDEPNIVVIEQPARTEYVTKTVNVHEHRAPTDDSVKLLREMEAKAEAEVLKAISVGNSDFECVVHTSLDNLSDKMRWRAIFKLNGKRMTAHVETHPREDRDDPSAAFNALRDEMAKVIATEVLGAAYMTHMRARWTA